MKNRLPIECQRAHWAVKKAIKNGILVRPKVCEKCKKIPEMWSDGRRVIQAHHSDYSKPLEVEWLCAPCHKKITPNPRYEKTGGVVNPPRGTKNGQSKLNDKQVRKIRRSTLPNTHLAKIYGVHEWTIRQCKKGATWKHVK